MSVSIRPALPEDAGVLKALDPVVLRDPARAELIDAWLCHDTVLVAEDAGRVIGYGVFNHAFFHQAQLDMLMVHPDFRGRGIGGLLLQAFEAGRDTPKFYVTTNLTNHRMQRLLLRRGYKACGYIDA